MASARRLHGMWQDLPKIVFHAVTGVPLPRVSQRHLFEANAIDPGRPPNVQVA